MVALACVVVVCATVIACGVLWFRHTERIELQKGAATLIRADLGALENNLRATVTGLSERMTALENRTGRRI